jgi:hypothetical protein
MPLANTEAMRHAYLRDVGATYNDICYFSQPADSRFQVTTPNASTNYVYFNFNLKARAGRDRGSGTLRRWAARRDARRVGRLGCGCRTGG